MKLLLLNREEDLISVISETTSDPIYDEVLNGEDTFEFEVSEYSIEKGYRVLFQDINSDWREYVVTGIEEKHNRYGLRKKVYCESSYYELLGDWLADIRPNNRTARYALEQALSTSRWEVGIVDDLGLNSTNYYRTDAKTAVETVAEVWGGEIKARIEVTGNKVTGRFVDLYRNRGTDSGKRFAYTKDIEEVTRDVSEDLIITALHGFGKSEEIGDGFGRRIDFSSINNGKTYLENNSARLMYGRNNSDGTKAHVFGKVEFDDIEDIELLKTETQKALDVLAIPSVLYKVQVQDLSIFGYEHEKVNLGDYVLIVDKEFIPELRFKARVVGIKRNLANELETEITIGNVLESYTSKMNSQSNALNNIRDRIGVLDKIADGSYSLPRADGQGYNYYGSAAPSNPHNGDVWFKPNGEFQEMWQYVDGQWTLLIDTSVPDQIKKDVENAIAEIADVKTDIDDRLLLVNQEIENNFTSLSTSIDNATDLVNTANANAQTALNSAQSAINQLGGLSGQLTKVQNDIDDINGVLLQKVSTADFKSLTGRVNVAEGQIQTQANQIALRVTETQAQTIANNAVGALEIGGTNLIRDSRLDSLISNNWTILSSAILGEVENVRCLKFKGTGSNSAYIQGNGSNAYFPLKRNTIYTYSIYIYPLQNMTRVTNVPLHYHIRYQGGNGAGIDWIKISSPENLTPNRWNRIITTFKTIDEEGVDFKPYVYGSHPTTSEFYISRIQLEEGNIVSDHSLAPEDSLELISNLTAELSIESNKITQLLTRTTNNETAINQVKSTADGTVQTVANHAGRLTTVETNVSGLQTTVADKVSNAQFTVLSNSVSSVVTDLNNLQVGGRNYFTKNTPVNMKVAGSGFILRGPDTPNGFRITGVQAGDTSIRIPNVITSNGWWTVSFDIKGTQSTPASVTVDICDKGAVRVYSNATNTYERRAVSVYVNNYSSTYNFVDFDSFSWMYFLIDNIKVEKGNKATDWSPAPEDMATQSQITQLSTDINLRVTKGDVMSQINIEAGRTLISSNKLYLDANTVTFSGSAFIPNAAISSLSADKVTTGTLNAANVNIINLNVSNLIGNTTSFVQSAWNGITSDVNIDSAGIVSRNTGNTVYTRLRSGNIEFGDDLNTVVGSFGSMVRSGSSTIRGIGIFVNHTKEFGVAKQWTSGGAYEYIMRSAINAKGLDIYTPTTIRATLNMDGKQIHNVNRIYFGDTTQGIARGSDASNIFVANNGIILGVGEINNYATKVHINDTSTFYNNVDMRSYVMIRNTLNMSGQAIHDVSSLLITGTTSGIVKASDMTTMNVVGNGGVWIGIGSVTSTWKNTLYVGNTVVRLHGAGLDMNGGSITNQSDARLKHNIHDTNESALAYLRQTRFVNYEWIDETKPRGIHLGVIAQDTPWLIFDRNADVLSIDNSKQVMYNSLGIKELISITDKHMSDILRIDTFVGQHEQEIKQLKQKIAELERKIT